MLMHIHNLIHDIVDVHVYIFAGTYLRGGTICGKRDYCGKNEGSGTFTLMWDVLFLLKSFVFFI